jgi:hypothetical protein
VADGFPVGDNELGGASSSTTSHLDLEVASASSNLVVMLLIFWAGLPGAPPFISLHLLGGGVLLGDGARKELWRVVDVGAVSPCAW